MICTQLNKALHKHEIIWAQMTLADKNSVNSSRNTSPRDTPNHSAQPSIILSNPKLSSPGVDKPTSPSKSQTRLTPSFKGSSPRNSSSNNKQEAFMAVVRKMVVLTVVGVGTTILGGVMIGIVGINILWVCLDCVCNTLVTLLMFQWNKGYYEKLFSCCDRKMVW